MKRDDHDPEGSEAPSVRAWPHPVCVASASPPTSAPRSSAMDPDEVARVALATLRQRHRDLDTAIEALAERGTDPLTVRRLKKRKLMLRDRIMALEDRLTPDIIA